MRFSLVSPARWVSMLKVVVPALALLAASLAAQPSPAAAPADFVVIVNAGNPVSSIQRDDLSRMFLKRLARWADGTPVDAVDLPPTIRPRVAFTLAVHRKSVGAVRAFWQQQIFSGRNVPPAEKRGEQEVIAYVRANAGAVGYVSVGQPLQQGVKALDIQGLSP